METAKHLILENSLGQQVRSFRPSADEFTLIYRLDTRRVEAHADLSVLDDAKIEYTVLSEVSIRSMKNGSLELKGLGRLRVVTTEKTDASPSHELAIEDDSNHFQALFKKTAAIHVVLVGLLILISALLSHFAETKTEPELVTITLPKPEEKKPEHKAHTERVQVAKKVVPKATVVKKVMVQKVRAVKPAVHASVHTIRHPIANVRKEKPRDLSNLGALAALGGIKNGTRGYQGLDSNSLKNIRSAGAGVGGGGVGDAGAGGISGVLPGRGLIAGSAGKGGRAEGAGGYGTRGEGGGRAGYGKIALVGGTGGLSLPSDDEVVSGAGLDRDQIAAVINRNKGQIIYCYEQGLQGEPTLNGRVDTDFVIEANGRISTNRVDHTSLRSQLVESCILAKMKNWQFPHPVGGVQVAVQYPFELRRVSGR
jgi:hypothetical protein